MAGWIRRMSGPVDGRFVRRSKRSDNMSEQVQRSERYESAEYLDLSFTGKGVGGWRSLYLPFLKELKPRATLEVGAGTPDFLLSVPTDRKVAVDIGDRFADVFGASGIEFFKRDLDHDALVDLGPFDALICSDVFEHLINPAFALDSIADALSPAGVLFAHVPNEYRFDTLRIMMGKTTSVRYHGNHEEWEDPHFRRFTDIGFARFLARRFKHSVKITDLRYGRAARLLRTVGLAVPYFLEGGPTYICTNDDAVAVRMKALKRRFGK